MSVSFSLKALVAAGLLATAGFAMSHGDVTPQEVDTGDLPDLGKEALSENPFRKGNEHGDKYAEAVKVGKSGYAGNCAVCHGENARGNRDLGAPNLTDPYWVYGGDLQTIVDSVHGGRQGHMPTWDERLTEGNIKILALYVHSLGADEK